jgi:cytochrome c556
MKKAWVGIIVVGGALAFAQTPTASPPPAANLRQLMLDLIHPSSNDILLLIYRGGPQNEKDWALVRRSALTLADSGNLLMTRGRALGRGPDLDNDQGDWMKDAQRLADAGAAAYSAAQAKDAKALAAVAEKLDAACTACHKQYRPNVFPPEGGSK